MKMLQHKFVEFIPSNLKDGVLYISMEYATAIHKCVCGCGNEVVTPLSLTDWKISYNGKTISLYPSIGNWNFECQSHYWIRDSNIEHAGRWTEAEIRYGRKGDRKRKKQYFKEDVAFHPKPSIPAIPKPKLWERFLKFFHR